MNAMSSRDILLSATLEKNAVSADAPPDDAHVRALADTIMTLAEAGASIVTLPIAPGEQPIKERIENVRKLFSALGETLPEGAPPVFLSTEFLGPVGMQTRFDAVRAIRPQGVDLIFRDIFSDESDEGFSRLKGFFRWLKVMEVMPRFIMRTPSDVARFVRLRVFDVVTFSRPHLLFELGADSGHENTDTASALERFLAALDHQPVTWAACTHGADEAAVIFRCLLEGGHVHTGLACNRVLPDGTRAAHPQEPVLAACDIIRQTGGRPVPAKEAKAFLKESFK